MQQTQGDQVNLYAITLTLHGLLVVAAFLACLYLIVLLIRSLR